MLWRSLSRADQDARIDTWKAARGTRGRPIIAPASWLAKEGHSQAEWVALSKDAQKEIQKTEKAAAKEAAAAAKAAAKAAQAEAIDLGG